MSLTAAPPTLSPAMLLRFLVGDREAILALARSRHTLKIGALLVLAAALAREYDQEDLLRRPWYLAIPFVASIVLSYLMFLFVRQWSHTQRTFWAEYRSYLGLFWMTAPLALLYGVPYERFLSPADAVSGNLYTLALVAAWRVVLMARVTAVFTGRSMAVSFLSIMPVATGVAALGLYFMPVPLLNIMGGIDLTAAERRLASLHSLASALSTIGVILFGIAGSFVLSVRKPVPQPWLGDDESPSPRGLMTIAIAAVLLWVPFLPGAQREQRLQSRVDSAMTHGDVAAGLAEMSRHQRRDFPPGWSPLPLIGWRAEEPPLLDVMNALVDQPATAGWVREIYVDKFVRRYLTFYFRDAEHAPVDKLLDRLPEGPALREKCRERLRD